MQTITSNPACSTMTNDKKQEHAKAQCLYGNFYLAFPLLPVYGEISLKLLVLPLTNLVASWDQGHQKPFPTLLLPDALTPHVGNYFSVSSRVKSLQVRLWSPYSHWTAPHCESSTIHRGRYNVSGIQGIMIRAWGHRFQLIKTKERILYAVQLHYPARLFSFLQNK